MKRRIGILILVTVCMLQITHSYAQERTRILFLLDASLSMKEQWKGGTKWETAISSLANIADSIEQIPNIEIGLRVLGHLSPEPDKNCHDTRLEIPIDTGNVKKIKRKLEEIHPKGITPLVYAIEKTPGDFGTVPAKNVLIVITDGEDACDRDMCSVPQMLLKNNIILRPFIIGMSLQQQTQDDLVCMGKLYNTHSAAEFTAILKNVIDESISKTTLQVNLDDANGKPTETDVNMTFYDETGLARYNLYHSLNPRGLPDTLTISPEFKYKLQVNTIPPIIVENVQLKKNQHTVIDVKAPQGYLNFTLQGAISKTAAVDRIKCLVHKPGEEQTLNVQKINSKEKYLTGTYDLEVLTLPRTLVPNIKIDQSKTTDVQIPAPGILTINKSFDAYGAIFIVENKQMKKIYDLRLKDKQETIALQPGKYRIVYRSKNARTIHTTVDKEFEIVSSGSSSLKL